MGRIAREKRFAAITVTHDHRMLQGFDSVYQLQDGRLARVEWGVLAAASR